MSYRASIEVIYVHNTDTLYVLIRTPYRVYTTNQRAEYTYIMYGTYMNYSDFLKNRVLYNINKAKY